MNNIEVEDFSKFIVIGDRILIKPKTINSRTKSGLYLPPGVQEKERIQSGYIIKMGPGYPIPIPPENEDFWKDKAETTKYIPLQTEEGDLAIYLQNSAHEIEFNKEKYVIVPQAAILMVIRDEGMFN